MNKEIKDKWVNALRSGNYKQGAGYLKITKKNETTFCCLGVLCDVMDIPSVKLDNSRVSSFDGNSATLSLSILQKAGLNEEDQTDLINMNDDQEYTFEKIADYIEEYL